MEQIKRQSSNNFHDFNNRKKQKIQTTTDQLDYASEKSISCLEDLSNELIYEIFEFIDYFHVHEVFSNLNIRFHNLLSNSNLPITINLSSMSKSALKRYNADIIESNMHRIRTFCISNRFMYELVFSSIYKIMEFGRIKTLVLDNIESQYLENLLDQLLRSSLLSSLVISTIDAVKNANTIYRQIVRLPALKFCKLSLSGWDSDFTLPVSTNKSSPIEHLNINTSVHPEDLHSLLSYVPQLRRLFLSSLKNTSTKPTNRCPFVLDRLTHIDFKLDSIDFDQFERLIIDLFPMIQVLRLTSECRLDWKYLNDNIWEQLIISHIPNLRIFDIKFDMSLDETDINWFTTPFWVERQWFFAHQFYQSRYGRRILFYSINPYSRKQYILYKQVNENISSHHHHRESILNSVHQIHIESTQSIINCMNYFPNVNELIMDDVFIIPKTLIANILNRIIPLKQLTKLVFGCLRFSVGKLISMLRHTPNIHTLILESIPCYRKTKDYMSIEESQDFQLVSKTNTIRNVTCSSDCTLEQIKLFVALCPQMQCLESDISSEAFEPVARLILDKTNQYTPHLYSLCFTNVSVDWFKRLERLIKSEKLLDDYTLKSINRKIYLWW